MKKFHFRFKTLETIRKATENILLSELARSQRVLVQEISTRDNLMNELQNALKMRESSVSHIEFQMWDQRIAGLKQSLLRSDARIKKAQKIADRNNERYMNARKNVKAVEVLKDKDYSEYRQKRDRYLQKQSDDLVVMRHRIVQGEEA